MSHPIQSNEAPITGRIAHTDGRPASHYCVILTAGPCAVTTDADGNFATSFLPGFEVDLVIKGAFNGTDGPVVTTIRARVGAPFVAITVP